MNNERGLFVTVHGIDGTGKTTVTSSLVDSMNADGHKAINYDEYKDKTPNPYLEKKSEADKNGSLEDRIAIYLESTMYHGKQIDQLLNDGFHVVKSRYLDDVLAHFAHLGGNKDMMGKLKIQFPIVQPDLKIILSLDEDLRRERINTRGILDDRDVEKKEPGSRLYFFEDYLKKANILDPANSVLHLDSGKLNVEAITKKIIDHLLNLPGTKN